MESMAPVRRRHLARALAVVLLAVLGLGLGQAAAATPKTKVKVTTTGIVDIFTTLGYQDGAAAGTGIIVTPGGEVLTNNHVVRGATAIRVVDVATHHSYPANVVGYTVQGDIAVLQLAHASHLRTIPLGNSATLEVGQRVSAAGNAGGAGGTPRVASGSITALHRSIEAYDEAGGSEPLTNLIQTSAHVQPGDSGGPLLNVAGRVVGIVTAGRTGGLATRGAGWAIPINTARALAARIVAGNATATIHVGPTAFLGVSPTDAPNGGGAQIQSVVQGSPAEVAGLAEGDVITSLGGTAIGSSADLRAAVLALTPGTSVAIQWTDQSGTPTTAQITPISGPPQ
jgi:S1-C subfamily serine protease